MVFCERTLTEFRSKYTDIDANFINKIALPVTYLPQLGYYKLMNWKCKMDALTWLTIPIACKNLS